MSRFDPRVYRALGILLVCLSVSRLVGFGYEFAGEAVQTDFAAYYTAGQMVAAGLSPYRYLITPERIIWTSGDMWQHSQYIYPPLLAAVFSPVAQTMSYLAAKYLWWLLDLAALCLSLSLSRRALRLPLWPWGAAQLMFAGLFHPMLVQLLRGQIDLITAALIGGAFFLFARPGARRHEMWAGVLVGFATMIKFHAGFVFPFLVLRRKFHAVAGFGLAVVVLIGLNLAASPINVQRYLAEVPRISQYGGDGPPGSELPPEARAVIAKLFPPEGGVYKDGFLFRHRGFQFVTNASFVELICCGLGFDLTRPAASMAMLAFFVLSFGLMAWRNYLSPPHLITQHTADAGESRHDPQEYIYWFAITNVALLAGPTTWTMNVVWLLPALPIFIYLWRSVDRSLASQLAIALFASGLLLVALPDHRSYPALLPRVLLRLSIYKYPAGELLLILGSVVHLRRWRLRHPAREASQPALAGASV